jgi:hypothetical protein
MTVHTDDPGGPGGRTRTERLLRDAMTPEEPAAGAQALAAAVASALDDIAAQLGRIATTVEALQRVDEEMAHRSAASA